ncbi:retinol-binding protein pinta-like [Agrilus planipennis]|uniref:Retinol-binding protein pinta-like n=1 Tax=Agrilus planipennis TaxID=224129 RepID=A0A1W4WKF0_AGRPL|nr:retinol-binding protein pinta-like [Agrilus planipennis]
MSSADESICLSFCDSEELYIEELRQWILENPHLNAHRDDTTILAFLRVAKFNVETAKSKMRNYYIMRKEVPEWFTKRDPSRPEIQELVKLGIFLPLKKYHNNKLVVIIRTAAHDPRRHAQDDVFKTGKMVLDVAIRENFTSASVYGISAIFDMANISFGHYRQLTTSMIKRTVHAWQNYPGRPQHLEFVNAPLYINVVLNIFKSFMSEKLRKRVRVHFSGIESLHRVIPKEILPIEYGGRESTIKQLGEEWASKLIEYKDWFTEDETHKAK